MEENEETSIDSIKEELENLRLQNKTKNQQLASQEGQLSPLGILMTRLELFIQMALTEEQRIIFEYSFEREVSDQLDAALSEVARSKLLTPMTGPLTHPMQMPR